MLYQNFKQQLIFIFAIEITHQCIFKTNTIKVLIMSWPAQKRDKLFILYLSDNFLDRIIRERYKRSVSRYKMLTCCSRVDKFFLLKLAIYSSIKF